MTLADLPSLAAVLQDERVMYAYEGAFSDAETALWMQKQLRRYREHGFGLWAVVLKDTREMIGQCGITCRNTKGNRCPKSVICWHTDIGTEGMPLRRPWLAGNTDSIR